MRLAFALGERSHAELTRSQRFRFGFVNGAGGGGGAPLRLGGHGWAISALKQAEDGDALVLRVWNPGAWPARLTLEGELAGAYRCRMDETQTEPVSTAEVALGPRTRSRR